MNTDKILDKLKVFYGIEWTQLKKRLKASREYKGKCGLFLQVSRLRQEAILKTLFEKSYTVIGDELSCTAYVTKEPVPFSKRYSGKPLTLREGSRWAEEVFDCAWLHLQGKMPTAKEDEELVFLLDTGGEGLIYDREGHPMQGITCHASQFDFCLGKPVKKVVFPDNLYEKDAIDFFIDIGANDLFGNIKLDSSIKTLRVARMNKNIRALAYDIQVLLTVFDYNADDDYIKSLYKTLCEVLGELSGITEDTAVSLRKKLQPFILAKNTDKVFNYSAIGHAHLDLAWLWPLRESKRKGARTLCNQFVNIEHYPDYCFGASQAQLYQWIRDGYPELYEKMRGYIENGRWEVQGATWVEMDSNLIGGLSMIKQFYYGKKYFLEEFGLDMKILWLPDSFGYSACLPQVMKLASVPYFLTQKMSWNTVNKFPYHTFNWSGLDGTTVFAHMLPENTYNGPARGDYLKAGEKTYTERKISDKSMSLFGIGDGGGGPGFEHCERAMRYKDLRGMPTYTIEKAVDFFGKLDDKVTPYPSHKGELYLEKHQGTYTTQGRNKKYNRKCEYLLRNYEILLALAKDKVMRIPIDEKELEMLWKEVLLYQFHDILPGSSINRVYEESQARYKVISDRLNEGIASLSAKLFKGRGLVNFNSFEVNTPIFVDGKWYEARVPAVGFAPISEFSEIIEYKNSAKDNVLENDKVKVVFTKGVISSITDKTSGREVVPDGKRLNVFSVYCDIGNCWDISPVKYQKSKQKLKCTSFTIGTSEARAFAEVEYTAKNISVKQKISIIDGSAAIRFDTTVNNSMKSQMLRVAMPVNVKTDVCSFNIQFGHLERKTTENNSVEKAQFEVSGQKFVDMSADGFGVTVINDCKYGYRCKGNVIDMDVLRSPMQGPGRNVDFGESSFSYEIMPHLGGVDENIYKEAYLFNNPLMPVLGTGESGAFAGFSTNNENLILEGVKVSEDGRGYVLYVYNSSDKAQTGNLKFNRAQAVKEVDIFDKAIGENVEKFNGFELKFIYCVER